MSATPDFEASLPPARPTGSAPCADVHDTISNMLARCAALYSELGQLRTEHAALLRAAEGVQHSHDAERQRRAQVRQTTLDLLSALAVTAPAESRPTAPAQARERAA